jgi:apolipoprotein N-acyltransferase
MSANGTDACRAENCVRKESWCWCWCAIVYHYVVAAVAAAVYLLPVLLPVAYCQYCVSLLSSRQSSISCLLSVVTRQLRPPSLAHTTHY